MLTPSQINENSSSEQLFRSFVENHPDGIVHLDTKGRHLYINQSALHASGLSAAALLGKNVCELPIPGNPELMRPLLNALLNVVATATEEAMEFTWPNGNTSEIRHIPEFDELGSVVSVLAIARDITEHKRIVLMQEQREREFRTLAENSSDNIARYDCDCRILYINQHLEKIIGMTLADVIGKTPLEIFPDGRFAELQHMMKQVIASGEQGSYYYSSLNSDGATLYHHLTLTAERDESGHICGLLIIGRDITALKEIEEQLRTILNNQPDVIVRYDRDYRRLYVNPEYEKVNGLCAEEVLGKTPEQLSTKIAPIAKDYQAKLKHVFECGELDQIELSWCDHNGNQAIYDIRIIPEYDSAGDIVSVLTIARDVLEIKLAEQLLKTKEREFRTLVENSPDIIVRYDRDCRRSFVNQAYVRQTGTSIEAALNVSIDDVSIWRPSMSRKQFRQRLQQVMDTGVADKILLEWTRLDGQWVSHEMYVVAEYDANNQVIGTLALGRDVTQSRKVEQQLLYLANYDTLTGLPNRRLFNEKLNKSISQAKQVGESVGLLFIDLDRFKTVNDTMGHELGDQLLIEVAQRINQCVGESDTVARLASDEFVVILPDSDELILTKLVRSIVDFIAYPFYFEQHHTHTSACIGIAVYPQDATTAEALLSCADQAMYEAKKAGLNNFKFFNGEMLVNAKHRIHLANDLHTALIKGQLEVYYQPIIDMASGQTIKAEALLRWHHPELGMVPPDQFIPIAEEIDLIQEIGYWVFCQAIEAAKQWNMFTDDGYLRQISINMSPRQFRKSEADQQIIDYLQHHNHDPAHIAIEITEGLLLDDSVDTARKLDNLRAAGFEISLDDFGTGYSAMAYLKKFNIDYLKMDRSFVHDLETDPATQAIAEAIVVMSHRLGLKVIAEGVETVGQYDLLAAMNCEYMQGYLFAKPMPIEQFIDSVNYDNGKRHIQR